MSLVTADLALPKGVKRSCCTPRGWCSEQSHMRISVQGWFSTDATAASFNSKSAIESGPRDVHQNKGRVHESTDLTELDPRLDHQPCPHLSSQGEAAARACPKATYHSQQPQLQQSGVHTRSPLQNSRTVQQAVQRPGTAVCRSKR